MFFGAPKHRSVLYASTEMLLKLARCIVCYFVDAKGFPRKALRITPSGFPNASPVAREALRATGGREPRMFLASRNTICREPREFL